MAEPIDYLVGQLPASNLTTRALRVLDYIVPDAWGNIHDFNALIEDVTKVRDRDFIDRIHVQAMRYYKSENESYQTAMRLYALVDNVDIAIGAVSAVSNLGRDVGFLSFLEKVTPKADTAQAIDAALKLTVEVIAFFLLYDLPKDSFKSFVGALGDYAYEEKMRLAAWIAFDGLVPLGPDFMDLIIEKLHNLSADELGENKLFKAVKGYIPGGDNDDKLNFIQRAVGSAAGWVNGFVEEHNITQEGVVKRIRGALDVADKSLDYVAAAIDVSTNYFEHTGTQTVARAVIRRAWDDLRPAWEARQRASSGGGSASAGRDAMDGANAAAAAAAAAAAMAGVTQANEDAWADDWGSEEEEKPAPAPKKKEAGEWDDEW